MKVLLRTDNAHVYIKAGRIKDENDKVSFATYPVIRGVPEKYAVALIKHHGAENALGVVDRVASTDVYWILVRRRITNLLKVTKDAKQAKTGN